jgi:glycerophosphoryl diester phosphodiesterase
LTALPKILLLGHRGAGRGSAENTIAAFDLALLHGADGFEFDVRRTSDGKTILCHDPKLHRLVVRRSNFKQLHAAVSLRREMPSTLEQVLSRYGRSAFLNIEVKVRGMEELVARAVKRARLQRYFISSFLPSVIRRLHALDDSLVLGALAQTRWQLRRWKTLPATYVVPHYRLLSRRLVARLHDAGKLVVTWTVNDRKQMLRAAGLGVDGIISDDTKLLVETLGTLTTLARRPTGSP